MTPDLVSAWCSTAPLLIPRGGSHTRDCPGPVFGGSEVHREGQRSPGASQVLTYLLPRHLVIWGLGLGTHPLGAPPFCRPQPVHLSHPCPGEDGSQCRPGGHSWALQ